MYFNMDDFDETYVMMCMTEEESTAFIEYLKDHGKTAFLTGGPLTSMYKEHTDGVGYRFNARKREGIVDYAGYDTYRSRTDRPKLFYSTFDWGEEEYEDFVSTEDILAFLG